MSTQQVDAASSTLSTDSGSRRGELIRLFVQPVVAVLIGGVTLLVVFSGNLDANETSTLNKDVLLTATLEHLQVTALITLLVVAISIPLGVVLTRRWAKPVAPIFTGIATIGQAAPAIGVVVLYFLWQGEGGVWVAVLPLTFVSLLPVLRNTMVGIEQVDPALVDAGKGIGLSPLGVLFRVELPLAVPLILAGLRTSLVLAVGTATLALFVDAGGLGSVIDAGYKIGRISVLFTGAALTVALALLLDWLGALAERYLGPKGLR